MQPCACLPNLFIKSNYYILTDTFEEANKLSKKYEMHSGTESENEHMRQKKFYHDHPTYKFSEKGVNLNEMFDAAGKIEELGAIRELLQK